MYFLFSCATCRNFLESRKRTYFLRKGSIYIYVARNVLVRNTMRYLSIDWLLSHSKHLEQSLQYSWNLKVDLFFKILPEK